MASTAVNGVPTPRPPTKKRLVVCCDGTWQSSNHGKLGIPSNIARLARSIAKYDNTTSETIHQYVWYQAGVGTAVDNTHWKPGDSVLGAINAKLSDLSAKWTGLSGEGLDENVCAAYGFLADNYNPGDEVYFFGFSRGAYTARAAAGLVAEVGLCKKDMMDLFPAMYDEYKTRDAAGASVKDTDWARNDGKAFLDHCTPVPIKFVGVFDTVGALGIPRNAILSHSTTEALDKPYEFHNTALHFRVENAYHALALSEHRQSFQPCLWTMSEPVHARPGTKEGEDLNKTTKMVQCWFPGVHINCGGGNNDGLKPETCSDDLEAMSTLTFSWMVDRVMEKTDLQFNDNALERIVQKFVNNTEVLLQNSKQTLSPTRHIFYKGWGIGPVSDKSYEAFASAGSEVRTPGAYKQPGSDEPLGQTNEHIHPVAAYAGYGYPEDPEKAKTYDPDTVMFPMQALKRFKRVPQGQPGSGSYLWKKDAVAFVEGGWLGKDKPEEAAAEVPEWNIPATVRGKVGMERRIMQADLARPVNADAVKHAGKFETLLDEFRGLKVSVESKMGK